ncbi:MAG TPA: hypothetical protein VH877_26615 [Polyangia bacterium]|nr:hypothetical protein [Polyangia bacterium]
MRVVLACTFLGGMGACGSPNEFIGRVAGQSLDVREAIFRKDSADVDIYVHLTDAKDLCQRLNSGAGPFPGTTVFTMDLRGPLMRPEVTIGTYRVNTNSAEAMAEAVFVKTDGAGTNVVEPSQGAAVGGLVILDGIDARPGGVATGNFDLTVGTQADRIRGDFRATYCVIGH